ncbi:MAG: hypothetical protein V3T16_05255 [Gemmatimonadales bacterium]
MRDIDWFGRIVGKLAPLFLIVAVPTALQAQFSIAPTIGVYVPTQNLLEAAAGDPQAAIGQQVSIAVGGRMALGFGRFGLVVSGEYAPSSLSFSAAGVGDTTLSANVVSGTGQLWLQVLPQTSMVSLALSGGVSVTSRGGDAFLGVANTTNVGGVVGAALGFRVGQFLHLTLTAEDYIYNAQFLGGVGVVEPTQHDIHLNFGVGIPLLGF